MQVFVARQPIFDKKQKVIGYELLYRIGYENYYDRLDGDRATADVIANSFLLIGIEALTGGKRAFINFSQNLMQSEVVFNLPRELVAVEVLEDVQINAEIIAACHRLKQNGYMLVLDDFVFTPDYMPLIELADIIKVDFLNTAFEERLELARWFGNKNVSLLAEKVETRAAFEEALEMGYSYFQGYFFSKPVVLSGQDISVYKMNYLQALSEINRSEPDFGKIEGIIKRDVSMAYKLLKYINSAAYGFRKRISSIRHALVMLGIAEVKKWISLIALRGMIDDKPDEIMTSSVIRAKFGELLAPMIGYKEQSAEIFLMGMFSMIDAIVDRPMSEVVSELPISEEIKMALMGERNHYRDVYELILSYEKGDWDELSRFVNRFRLNEIEIPRLYYDSLEWVNGYLRLSSLHND